MKTIEELRSRRFDAWTKFHDALARYNEHDTAGHAQLVEKARAELAQVDAELAAHEARAA